MEREGGGRERERIVGGGRGRVGGEKEEKRRKRRSGRGGRGQKEEEGEEGRGGRKRKKEGSGKPTGWE